MWGRPRGDTCHLLGFMVQREITEADAPTIQLEAVPSTLSVPHLYHPYHFTPDALPAETLPIYPNLGQASSMLGCIPGGLVRPCLLKSKHVIGKGCHIALERRLGSHCSVPISQSRKLIAGYTTEESNAWPLRYLRLASQP